MMSGGATRTPAPRRMSLLPLFLISAAAVGYEIALTRYFAVAKWSEYGYWVISIVMAGFALSGVSMALLREWAVRRAPALLAALPPLLVLAAAGGYWGTTANPFNPLQLQNAATFAAQLGNIALYYAVLLPFFFLTGFYIWLMFVLHPFHLVPALLVPLASAAFFGPWPGRVGLAALLALAVGGGALLFDRRADYNDFKAIYAPLHVPDGRVVAEIHSPRGLYAVLDNFTERLDTDVSNNAGLLGVPGPPQSFGVYRDGNRLAALPKPGGATADHAPAALDALPYLLRPGARVLLAGAGGGFKVAQALALGAGQVVALEPDPVLMRALRDGIGPSPALPADERVRLSPDSPLAAARAEAARGGGYDLVDLSGDFLEAGEANTAAFTAEALQAYLRALAPGGLVSLPVSIREFPVYAARVFATVREALLRAGVGDPASHVVVYRSAWNVRVLVSDRPWTPEGIAAVWAFADERSFDVSYFPGMDPAARAGIYNDLPAVGFESGQVAGGEGAQDAIADEAGAVLRGQGSPSQAAFNLSPITLDRPGYYAVLRLSQLGLILQRLEILPQAEIGQLVNLAVLAQAVVIAALVLLVPLAVPRVAGRGAGRPGILRPALYFASLGLGFLFIEIFLIEKASLYLNDRTSAFALVLTGMLVFSGVGSCFADRMRRFGVALSCAVVVGWCALVLLGLEGFLLSTLDLPWAARAGLLLAVTAPVSLALGLPFPLGLARAGAAGGGFLPWAWGLNGAFSVVATPLATLVAVQAGFDRLLLAAVLLYATVFLAHPSTRKTVAWQSSPLT